MLFFTHVLPAMGKMRLDVSKVMPHDGSLRIRSPGTEEEDPNHFEPK